MIQNYSWVVKSKSKTEKRFEETGLALIFTVLFIMVFILSSNLSNNQNTEFYSFIIAFATFILFILALVLALYSIKYMAFLLDTFFDDMLSGK